MSAESERVLLGSLLRDNAQLGQIDVQKADFSVTVHAQIFEAIRRMIGAGKVTDPLTVSELLERETGRKDWVRLLIDVQRECLAPQNAKAYAQVIRRSSIARQAAVIGQTLINGDDIDVAIKQLMALNATTRDFTCHHRDAIREAIDSIVQASEGALPGVPTGMRDIDAATGGMHDEDLIVVAARPSMGKTAFMLNLALAANKPIGIISGEQGRQQIGMRMIAIDGKVNLHHMRTGSVPDTDWVRINAVLNAAKERPIWLYDKPGPTIEDIVRQARAWKFDQNIGMLMIDYLQKVRGGQGENFRLQVGDVCVQLKDLARELKVPVVLLAQVSRGVEARPMGADGLGRMPYAADIAESSIIEQEADLIMTLYRPEVYDDAAKYHGLAFANFCKNRHGPVGHKSLVWRGEYLQFGDLAHQESLIHDRWSAVG